MRRRLLLSLTFCFVLGALAAAQNAPQQAPAATTLAVQPADRLSKQPWAERHAAILEKLKANTDFGLIYVGDSITQGYERSIEPNQNFAPIWQQYYAPRKALNLGFSGDRTTHVLWRLQHGEVDGLHPKVAVVLIGTNDTNGMLKEGLPSDRVITQAQAGIDAVVAELERRLPQTKILLLGILPTGISAQKTEVDQTVNRYLAKKYERDARVTYMDIGSIFYEDGKLNTRIFYDPHQPSPRPALHPDTVGQRKMAEAIEPTLAKLFGDTPVKAQPATSK